MKRARPQTRRESDTRDLETDSLEGVGAASGDLLAGGAPPDARHLALGGVLATEGARVLGVLGDLLGDKTATSSSIHQQRRRKSARQGGRRGWGSRQAVRERRGVIRSSHVEKPWRRGKEGCLHHHQRETAGSGSLRYERPCEEQILRYSELPYCRTPPQLLLLSSERTET